MVLRTASRLIIGPACWGLEGADGCSWRQWHPFIYLVGKVEHMMFLLQMPRVLAHLACQPDDGRIAVTKTQERVRGPERQTARH
jgi:hypothetical protein